MLRLTLPWIWQHPLGSRHRRGGTVGSDAGRSEWVPVQAIDQLPSLRHAACWTLDVGGHEQAVLAGATDTLLNAPPAVILCDDRSRPVQRLLIDAGFHPCCDDPLQRLLRPEPSAIGTHQRGVRAMTWVRDRIRSAPAFTVLGERI